MKKKDNDSPKTSDLRERAEAAFRAKTGSEQAPLAGMTHEGTRMLLHELQVHQIELEMQNEELRLTQLELETARARYFDLYDLAPVGYITINEKGLIVEGNLTAADLLGVTRGELDKQPISRFILKEDQDMYYLFRKLLQETGEKQTCELRMMKNEGAAFWALLKAVMAHDEDGGSAIRAVVSDITDRKALERQREESTATLQEKNDEMETILYASSHDLRSPLVSIRGFNDRIQKAVEALTVIMAKEETAEKRCAEAASLIDHDIPTAIRHIGASAEKMEALITGILKISRLNSVARIPENINMNELIRRMFVLLDFQIQQARVTVTVGDLPSCWGDPLEIAQVFSNLIDNAIKYRDPVRPLTIGITGTALADRVSYSVEDTGIGIKPQHYGQIWGLFSRIDPGGPVMGEGIGLAMVKRIVERNCGKIWIESEPGVGSKFYLSLPQTETP